MLLASLRQRGGDHRGDLRLNRANLSTVPSTVIRHLLAILLVALTVSASAGACCALTAPEAVAAAGTACGHHTETGLSVSGARETTCGAKGAKGNCCCDSASSEACLCGCKHGTRPAPAVPPQSQVGHGKYFAAALTGGFTNVSAPLDAPEGAAVISVRGRKLPLFLLNLSIRT